MTGHDDNSVKSSPDHEQLVAYLDGEVDAAAAQAVEERLARDAGFRQTLNDLQRSWDLLGDLPQPTTDESFTKTTVEMVALRTDDDIKHEQQAWFKRQDLRRLAGVSGILASLLLGFLAYRYWLDAPNRQLKVDLPVIERVDVYQHIDNLQFLEQLQEEGLFDEHVDEESATEIP